MKYPPGPKNPAARAPGVDSGWDALHSFVRIPAGALLAAGAAGSEEGVVGRRPVGIDVGEAAGHPADAADPLYDIDSDGDGVPDGPLDPDLYTRARAAKITGTPALLVNGKYHVSTRKAGGQAQMLQVVDYLVEKERAAAAK